MLFYPERVALLGVLVYLGLWVVAPLHRVYPLAGESLIYVGLSYLAFFSGCLLVSGGKRGVVQLQSAARFSPRTFWFMALLGITGMALRVYDKLYVRGISLQSTALESRELLAEASAGPLAAFGGLLYPFCYVPLIFWWARTPKMRLHPAAKWVAMLLFTLPALDALLLLSRSQLLVALSMMYFAGACVLFRGQALHARLMVPAGIGLTALLVVSATAFSYRLDQMNLDLFHSILNSSYGYALTPNDHVLSVIANDDGIISGLLGAFTPFLQYYLHGPMEFSLLWERPDNQVLTFGVQHFAPYVKALSVFGVLTYPEFATDAVYYRSGVFTSFFGPLWIDFGWLGLLLMVGLGALSKYCAHLARRGELAAMPLYAYLCLVLFFMPVVNFIVSAQGMYVLNAFLLVWAFGRHQPRRHANSLFHEGRGQMQGLAGHQVNP